MKKTTFLTCLILLLFLPPVGAANLSGEAHVQNMGWIKTPNSAQITLGTTGKALRMEAFRLKTDDPELSVVYEGHVEDIGWQSAKRNGAISGTTGQAKRIEAFKVYLQGRNASKYSIGYRAHVENYGWLGWAYDGQSAGTAQHAFRCEALELKLIPKNSDKTDGGQAPAVEAVDRLEARNMYKTNQLRKRAGLRYLTGNVWLHECAKRRSEELAVRFGHVRPDGRKSMTMLEDLYPNHRKSPISTVFTGENIAACSGYSSGMIPETFYTMWFGSDGHLENMLYNDHYYFSYAQSSGIGGPYEYYGVQYYGRPV